jgi:DNA excision repair protein ERCC-4
MRRPLHSEHHDNDYKLKSIDFPEGFVLLQDTREQRPLFTRLPSGLVVKSCTLHDGDYSIMGFESSFAIERKQISDFCGYCGSEHDRTAAKMKRFRDFEFVGLVIEAKEKELLQFQQFSKVHPEVLRSALVSFEVRYGVHVHYSTDRNDISRWMLDRCVKYWKMKHEIEVK